MLPCLRCMAVKSTPVQHEEVDFADMCARLKHQLATIEGQMNTKMNEQAAKYEATIKNLKEEVILFVCSKFILCIILLMLYLASSEW